MTQQAQNDHYADAREAALAYAAAVNEEIRDLFAAGADYVQLDEPYMQARPQEAERYGIEALNRALEGIEGPTCVHICFGYAALIHERPSGYSFLPQLHDAACSQVSIETAQSGLDCTVLEMIPAKQVLLGVIDLSTPEVETPEVIRERVLRALEHAEPERILLSTDCGMKYLPRASAFGKLQSMVAAAEQLREEFAG
jgi:5-methyltetrahydropteroyltriglutamate--homocysteine methyltransferase